MFLSCKVSGYQAGSGGPILSDWRKLAALLLMALFVLAVSCSDALTNEASVGDRSHEEEANDQLLLDGAQLRDQLGEFKVRGDRAIFMSSDGKQQFGGLENKNLERIVRMISDNPSQLTWEVSGTVTEYRGTNYLLVSHAVVKTRHTTISQPNIDKDAADSP